MKINLAGAAAIAAALSYGQAAAQMPDMAAMQKWASVTIVHYEAVGVLSDKHVQIPAADADQYADVVEKVTPSILAGRSEGLSRIDEFEARHVVETGRLLMQRSRIIADRVMSGKLAIVGLTYALHEGAVQLRAVYGDVGGEVPTPIRVEGPQAESA